MNTCSKESSLDTIIVLQHMNLMKMSMIQYQVELHIAETDDNVDTVTADYMI